MDFLATIPVPGNFRLLPTVFSHGWFQCPPFHWQEEQASLQRVLRIPAGRVITIEIREGAGQTLKVFHDGTEISSEDVDFIVERVRWMLQLDRDVDGFHHLCRSLDRHRIVAEIGAGRLLRGSDLWEDLVKAICGTNIAWPQAVRSTERICKLGESSTGGNAWPTPERVLEAGEDWLREEGRVGYRAKSIVELARSIEDGSFEPQRLVRDSLLGDDLQTFLTSVPGIGPATSAYLMALHGDASRLSIDSAVIAFCSRFHFDGRKPTPAEVENLYQGFGEWRALIYWFEFLLEQWWPEIGRNPDAERGLNSIPANR